MDRAGRRVGRLMGHCSGLYIIQVDRDPGGACFSIMAFAGVCVPAIAFQCVCVCVCVCGWNEGVNALLR